MTSKTGEPGEAGGVRALDREILRLAVPALGALAAEPLYILTDTAVVGHLGTPQLGGLAVAGAILTTSFWAFNFLAYGTTAAVARFVGAGNLRAAARQAVQGLWLALGVGVVLAGLALAVAPATVSLMGPSAEVRPNAVLYLRIAGLGAPAILVALVGVGYLRGLQDTATPLRIALAANLVNLIAEVVLIIGLDFGLAASAWTTVAVQYGAAVVFLRRIAHHVTAAAAPDTATPGPGTANEPHVPAGRQPTGAADGPHSRTGEPPTGASDAVSWAPDRRAIRALAVVGRDLFVRTGSLLLALAVATSVASRLGTVPLGAHQVAFQLWTFLAFVLDALAIAAQAMVGRLLGAGKAEEARAVSQRLIRHGVVAGVFFAVVVAVLRPVLATLFTDDPAVTQAAEEVLWVVAALQPVNAVVFVLDGVLIGAGDLRYLARAMVAALAVFLPAALAVGALDGPLPALWGAIVALMLARFAALAWRFAGPAWQVTGPGGQVTGPGGQVTGPGGP